MKIIVTGGAKFIGSIVIRHIIKNNDNHVLNVDKLTCAGNLESLIDIENDYKYSFKHIDICDSVANKQTFNDF